MQCIVRAVTLCLSGQGPIVAGGFVNHFRSTVSVRVIKRGPWKAITSFTYMHARRVRLYWVATFLERLVLNSKTLGRNVWRFFQDLSENHYYLKPVNVVGVSISIVLGVSVHPSNINSAKMIGLGQDTLLSQCLCPLRRYINGYRRIVGKPKLQGSDLRWTSIPTRGSRNTSSRSILQKPG